MDGDKTALIMEVLSSIKANLIDLKIGQDALAANYHQFRESYAGEYAKALVRTEEAQKQIDKLEKRMGDLELAVRPLVTWAKIAAWISSGMGLMIMALIWAILTHEVMLVVP